MDRKWLLGDPESFLETWGGFGKYLDFWKVGVLLESGGTFGKWGYFWKVGVLLESRDTFGKLEIRLILLNSSCQS